MSQYRSFQPQMYQHPQGMQGNIQGGMPVNMQGGMLHVSQGMQGPYGHHISHGPHSYGMQSGSMHHPHVQQYQHNVQHGHMMQSAQSTQNIQSSHYRSSVPTENITSGSGDIQKSSSLPTKGQKDDIIQLRGHKSDVFHAIFLKSQKLVSGGKDRTIKVWDYLAAAKNKSGNVSYCLRTLEGHTDSVTKLAQHPLQNEILCSSSRDKTAKLWDLRIKDKTYLSFSTNETNVDVRYNPTGHTFSVLTAQNNIFVFDERKENEAVYSKHFESDASLYEMEYGKGGKYLFITQSNHVIVLDIDTGDTITTIPITCDPSKTFCLRFDPTYNHLAVGSTDSIVSLLSTDTWSCQKGIAHLHDAVISVAFTYDTKWIAHAASKQEIIDITNVETGIQARTIACPEGVTSIDFAPDSYFLSVSNNGPSVRLYDLRTAPELM